MSTMEKVIVRFYAAAREAAGMSEISVRAGSLAEILRDISQENARLTQVLERCSFLIDGAICHDRNIEVPPGSSLDVLPPFAGG